MIVEKEGYSPAPRSGRGDARRGGGTAKDCRWGHRHHRRRASEDTGTTGAGAPLVRVHENLTLSVGFSWYGFGRVRERAIEEGNAHESVLHDRDDAAAGAAIA
jgi:hypothetical protein